MIRSITLLFFAFLLVSIPSHSYAKGKVKVGDTIPHNLGLKDQNGKTRSFSGLTGKKGLVLVFVRSAEWCPFCQKQLIELSKNNKKFTDLGYNIASVSYDAPKQIEKFVTKNKPKITMLSDPASESIRAFDILNTASAKGTMSYGIPHPGVYIIDDKKKVQAKFFESDYKKRPSVKTLIKKIKELNPPKVNHYAQPYSPPMTIENMGQDPILPGEEMIETPEKMLDPIVIMDEVMEPTMSDDAPVSDIIDMPVPAPAELEQNIAPVDPAMETLEEPVTDVLEQQILDPAMDMPEQALPEAIMQPVDEADKISSDALDIDPAMAPEMMP